MLWRAATALSLYFRRHRFWDSEWREHVPISFLMTPGNCIGIEKCTVRVLAVQGSTYNQFEIKRFWYGCHAYLQQLFGTVSYCGANKAGGLKGQALIESILQEPVIKLACRLFCINKKTLSKLQSWTKNFWIGVSPSPGQLTSIYPSKPDIYTKTSPWHCRPCLPLHGMPWLLKSLHKETQKSPARDVHGEFFWDIIFKLRHRLTRCWWLCSHTWIGNDVMLLRNTDYLASGTKEFSSKADESCKGHSLV